MMSLHLYWIMPFLLSFFFCNKICQFPDNTWQSHYSSHQICSSIRLTVMYLWVYPSSFLDKLSLSSNHGTYFTVFWACCSFLFWICHFCQANRKIQLHLLTNFSTGYFIYILLLANIVSSLWLTLHSCTWTTSPPFILHLYNNKRVEMVTMFPNGAILEPLYFTPFPLMYIN